MLQAGLIPVSGIPWCLAPSAMADCGAALLPLNERSWELPMQTFRSDSTGIGMVRTSVKPFRRIGNRSPEARMGGNNRSQPERGEPWRLSPF